MFIVDRHRLACCAEGSCEGTNPPGKMVVRSERSRRKKKGKAPMKVGVVWPFAFRLLAKQRSGQTF